MASGEIPSATAAVGAMPPIASGEWRDDGPDRAWVDPQLNELRNAIDHFHLPPAAARGDPTWAEWHYFNVLSRRPNEVGVHLVDRCGGSARRHVGRPGARDAAHAGRADASVRRDRSVERGAFLDVVGRSVDRQLERGGAGRRPIRRAREGRGGARRRSRGRESRRVAGAARVLPRRRAVEWRDGVGLRRAGSPRRARPDRSA